MSIVRRPVGPEVSLQPRQLSGSDSAPATDGTATATVIHGGIIRTASDSAPGADTSAAVTYFNHSRQGQETLPTVTDSNTSLFNHKRTPTDSAPAVDSAAQTFAIHGRVTLDTTVTSDAAGRNIILHITLPGQSAPATDAATRRWVGARSMSEALTTGDSAQRTQLVTPRNVSDSANSGGLGMFLDTPSAWSIHYRSVADNAFSIVPTGPPPLGSRRTLITRPLRPVFSNRAQPGITDYAVASRFAGRVASDSAPAVDSLTKAVTHFRNTTEVLSQSDSAVRSAGHFFRVPGDVANGSVMADSSFRVYIANSTYSTAVTATMTQGPTQHERNALDAAPANDTGHVPINYQVSGSDIAHATDSATRLVVLAASTTYSTSVQAALGSTTRTFPRQVSETYPTGDSATAWTLHARTAQDVISVGEIIARQPNFIRSVADSAPAVESLSKSAIHPRTASDVVNGGIDAAARTFLPKRSTTDATTTSDAAARFTVYIRNAIGGDTAHAVDSGSPATVHSRTSSDALPAITDAATRTAFYGRAVSQPLTTSDAAVLTSLSRLRTATDTAPANDGLYVPRNIAITRGALGGGEALTTSDFPTRMQVFPRVASDGANGFFDQITTNKVIARTVSDAVTGIDSLSKSMVHIVNLFEPYAVAESASRFVLRARSASDSAQDTPATDIFHPNDVATRVINELRTASELVGGMTDSATRTVPRNRSATDNAGGTDAVLRQVNYARALTDDISLGAGVVEQAVRSVINLRAATDTATANDVASRFAARGRTGSDTAPATDVATRGAAIQPRTASDSAPAVDSVQRSAPHIRTASDALSVATDTAIRFILLLRRGDEVYYLGGTFGGVDVATRAVAEFRSAIDVTATSDTASRTAPRIRTTADSAPALDTGVRNVVNKRTGTEATALTESAASTAGQQRSVSETAPAVDVGTRSLINARTSADAASAADAASRLASRSRSSNDSAPALEVAVRWVGYARAMGDTAGANDLFPVPHWAAHFRTAADSIPAATDHLNVGRWMRASDSAPAADALTSHVNLARAAADSIPAGGEVASSGHHIFIDLSEPAFVTDVATSTAPKVRSASDSIPLADSASAIKLMIYLYGFESAGASDVAAAGQRMAHGNASDALTTTDTASQWRRVARAATETLHIGELTSRQTPKSRTGSDAAPAVDSGVGARSYFRTAVEFVWGVTDVAQVIGGRYWRDATDATSLAEVADRVRTRLRTASDAAPAIEAATTLRRAIRSASDALSLSEAALRLAIQQRRAHDVAPARESVRLASVLARSTADALRTATDAGRAVVGAARTASDVTSNSDAATWLRTKVARAFDVLTTGDAASRLATHRRFTHEQSFTFDGARRQIDLDRAATDNAPAADATIGKPSIQRQTSDTAPAVDHEQEVLHTFRYLSERYPTREAATRHVLVERIVPDAAPATDAASRVPGIARIASDALVTIDVAEATPIHIIPFGPPVVITLNVDRTKVSGVPGCDVATVTFEFDQPVDRWYVHSDTRGLMAASYEGPPVTGGAAEVDADVLSVGSNLLTITARSPRGEWSRPV